MESTAIYLVNSQNSNEVVCRSSIGERKRYKDMRCREKWNWIGTNVVYKENVTFGGYDVPN